MLGCQLMKYFSWNSFTLIRNSWIFLDLINPEECCKEKDQSWLTPRLEARQRRRKRNVIYTNLTFHDSQLYLELFVFAYTCVYTNKLDIEILLASMPIDRSFFYFMHALHFAARVLQSCGFLPFSFSSLSLSLLLVPSLLFNFLLMLKCPRAQIFVLFFSL